MRAARLGRELNMLAKDPPPGVAAWPAGDDWKAVVTSKSDSSRKNGGAAPPRIDVLEASIEGPEGSPFEKGSFTLRITLPERYPFEPPAVRFETKVYHPNVDAAGRICLDSLKMPPKGAWQPSLNIAQILSQIRLLLAEPNPDDPLMPEISDLYRNNRNAFERRARDETVRHACSGASTTAQRVHEQSKRDEPKHEYKTASKFSAEVCNNSGKRQNVVGDENEYAANISKRQCL